MVDRHSRDPAATYTGVTPAEPRRGGRGSAARPAAPQPTNVKRLPTVPLSTAEAIRAAALELFATLGYRATTMADIGAAVGIKGPSIYKHVPSKQQLLAAIMTTTMESLLAAQCAALASASEPLERVQAAVRAHVRYHALHRFEAFVGNREIDSLDDPLRSDVLDQRARYERTFRRVISDGAAVGVFTVSSARLASYAILDMGMGVSTWYDPRGHHTPDDLADRYAEMAIDLLVRR